MDKMSSKNHPLILGEGSLIPGFEEEIVGMKKGETNEFKIKFPKDYHDTEIAGKEATFKISLNDAKEVVLPALDAEFAKGFGHGKMDELKKEIRKSLESEIEKEYQQKLESAIMDKMVQYLEAEVPEALTDAELDRMIEGYRAQVEGYGVKFDKYLESMNKSESELRKDMREQAVKNVKIGLLLGKLIEEQKLDPHDKESGRKALDHLIKVLVKAK